MPRTSALLLVLLLVSSDALARTKPNPAGRFIADPFTSVLAPPAEAAGPRALRRAAPVSLPTGAVLLDDTWYDLQDMGGLGKRIVVGDDGRIHVTYVDDFCELTGAGCPPDLNAPQPFPQRTNAYMWRDGSGVWSSAIKATDPTIQGCCVTELFGGFGAMGLTDDGRAVVVPHNNEDGCDPRAAMYVQESVGGTSFKAYLTAITDPSYLFPQVVALDDGSFTILAEIAEFGTYNETQEFKIARLAAEGADFVCPVGWQFGNWTSVVPDAGVFRDGTPAFPTMAKGADGRVGIAVTDFGGNVYLYESADGTFSSVTVTTITAYTDAAITVGDETSDQYRPYVHCDLVYDGNEPNVVWAELQGRRDGFGVFFTDYRSRIVHWNPTDGLSVVHQTAGEADSYANVDLGGTGPLAGFNTLSVDWPQIGLSDDGSETYVVWLRFVDGEIDTTADAGLPGIVTGIGYGDVAFARRTGVGTWTTAENLTNTPTADERFVSLAARNPNGKLHLVFQASATDEAGVTAIGDRGFANANFQRRIAFLDPPSGTSTSVASTGASVGRLRAWPNPSSGTVVFRRDGAGGDARTVNIYSVDGRRVDTLRVGAGDTPWAGTTIDGAPVASGVYFARVEGDSGPVTRFVIRR